MSPATDKSTVVSNDKAAKKAPAGDSLAVSKSVAPTNVNGRTLNRRGMATRALVIDTAMEVLATGEPGSVSANLVAKEAGVTWGTVRHTFGDADGVWAATLQTLMTDRRIVPPMESEGIEQRVTEIVESLWVLMDTSLTRAVENLRSALPVDYAELLATYPRTAEALAAWETKWAQEYELAFDGLGLAQDRVEAVRSLLPAALRGLLIERRLSTTIDIDAARASLAAGMALYLQYQQPNEPRKKTAAAHEAAPKRTAPRGANPPEREAP